MATIKVQFNDDIRRLTVQQNQLDNYKKLRKSIQKKYQNLPCNFVIKYQDEEGDFVTIASNPDLREALTQISPGRLLRLLLQVPQRNIVTEALPQISDFLTNAFASISVSKDDQPKPSVPSEPNCQVMELDVPFEEGYRFLNTQAIAFLNRQDYEPAEEILKQVIDLIPTAPVPHYNLACTYSLMGRVESALDYLERAIEYGYSNYLHLSADIDFENIRNNLRFVAILEKLAPKQSEPAPLEKQEIPVNVVEVPKESEKIVEASPKEIVEPVQKIEVPLDISMEILAPISPNNADFGMQASQIIVSEPTEFERALDQLLDMGFTDHGRNVQLLLQNNLDLLATVRSLLGF